MTVYKKLVMTVYKNDLQNIIFILTEQETSEIQLKENHTLQFIFNYY